MAGKNPALLAIEALYHHCGKRNRSVEVCRSQRCGMGRKMVVGPVAKEVWNTMEAVVEEGN